MGSNQLTVIDEYSRHGEVAELCVMMSICVVMRFLQVWSAVRQMLDADQMLIPLIDAVKKLPRYRLV
ncbi:hypothetical protein TNCV_3507001 [Trichonephila clavipes]|uniref:Uncharacterized protein n=1 Tax=Trichonephila clavipes TaxID=2585209 RepID=A0A8X6S1F8_TRICX|nr:hypothetical protein TNCV_3507001 [Trichonephila clavipes]